MILMRDLWDFRRMINNKIKIIINRINLHYKIDKLIVIGKINKLSRIPGYLKFLDNKNNPELRDRTTYNILIEKTWKIWIIWTFISLAYKIIWMAYLFQNKFKILNKLTNFKDIIIKNKIINTLNFHKKWVNNHTITKLKELSSSLSNLSRGYSHHHTLSRILFSLHIKDSLKVFPQSHLQDMSKDKLSISNLIHLNNRSMFFSNQSLLFTKDSGHLTQILMFKLDFPVLLSNLKFPNLFNKFLSNRFKDLSGTETKIEVLLEKSHKLFRFLIWPHNIKKEL